MGALAAAFAAAGADSGVFRDVLGRLDLRKIPDRRVPLPLISEGISLAVTRGAYAGDWIHRWLMRELDALDVRTFADLRRDDPDDDPALTTPDHRYRLVVMATDVTNGRLLRLPWDYAKFGLDPDEQLVADAVRMSLSIPFYFEPCTLRNPVTGAEATIVDGGVLSNFAIEIFDRTDGREPRWPTFGVRLLPDLPAGLGDLVPFFGLPMFPAVRLLEQVVATALVGRDQTHLERPGRAGTDDDGRHHGHRHHRVRHRLDRARGADHPRRRHRPGVPPQPEGLRRVRPPGAPRCRSARRGRGAPPRRPAPSARAPPGRPPAPWARWPPRARRGPWPVR